MNIPSQVSVEARDPTLPALLCCQVLLRLTQPTKAIFSGNVFESSYFISSVNFIAFLNTRY